MKRNGAVGYCAEEATKSEKNSKYLALQKSALEQFSGVLDWRWCEQEVVCETAGILLVYMSCWS